MFLFAAHHLSNLFAVSCCKKVALQMIFVPAPLARPRRQSKEARVDMLLAPRLRHQKTLSFTFLVKFSHRI